jgi:hypothetical protein
MISSAFVHAPGIYRRTLSSHRSHDGPQPGRRDRHHLFTLRWLQVDPDLHYVLWAAADLKARLTIDREVREQAEEEHAEAVDLMEPNVREQYVQALKKMEAQIDEARQRLAGRRLRLPSFEQRAREAGLPFAYSLAYRYDSITGAHPTPHAIEQLLRRRRPRRAPQRDGQVLPARRSALRRPRGRAGQPPARRPVPRRAPGGGTPLRRRCPARQCA